MKRTIATVLGALVLIALLTTSIVSARPQAAYMDSHFTTIPEGSTHSSYDGDYVASGRTIPLYTGWTTNLPVEACAISVSFAFMDDTPNEWGSLRPSVDDAYAVTARTQVANVWSDNAGIVPLNGSNAEVYLHISSGAYVYIVITGYWTCDEYVRPTPSP